jgi:E3 ubiquitin-protein ligase DOA10
LFADSCRALSADADSLVLLSVYNEEAVASLAMHQWARYHNSNWLYTLLYRELTADKSLPNYYRRMQQAELHANIAMLVILIMILSLIPLLWFLYLKPVVIQRRKERERRSNLEEQIAALKQENERLRTQLNMAGLAASQTAQTAQLIQNQNAQTQAVIASCCPKPVPAYTVPNPNCGCGGFSA